MSFEWETFPLEECLDALIDYRGKTPKKTDSGIPLITAKIIKDGRIGTPTEFIAADNYNAWMRRGIPECGDVVLTVEAPLGEAAQLGPEKVALAQRVVTLRGKKGFLCSTYLMYWLRSEIATEQLESRATGTTVLGIKQSELRKVQITVPPYDHQIEVALMLKALDDRIVLLHETNKTLESIAQAIFKSWFVDFDPVRANMEGRQPEGMGEETAALFPDSFEESELGLVPNGWQLETLGDVVTTLGGATPNTKNEAFWAPEEFHWTTPKDLSGAASPVLLNTERRISAAGLGKVSSGLLPVGTLLMSSRAPIGYLALSRIPVAINQGYIAMPPGGKLPPLFMYFWCKINMDAIKGNANGSTFMEISKRAFRPIPILLPPDSVLEAFVQIVKSLFDKISVNAEQADALAHLCDTLLPRLISGRLRLSEAKEIAESVSP